MTPFKLCILTAIISISFVAVYFISPNQPDFTSDSLVFVISDKPTTTPTTPTIPEDPTLPKEDPKEPTKEKPEEKPTEPKEEPEEEPKETPQTSKEEEEEESNNEPSYTGPNAKYCTLSGEKLAWKLKLRKHICSERPAFYKEIELPKIVRENLNIKDQDYIPKISISVLIHDPDHLNVLIRDPNNIRWELPFEDPYPYVKNSKYLSIEESNFEFVIKESPFSFQILRKSTKEIIYNFNEGFIFSDGYIEFAFDLPTNHLYGLGERTFSLQFRPGTYSLFIMDRTGEVENGSPGHNTQGHHSVYLMKEKSGNYHMNLLRNINSGEFTLNYQNNIKWIVIGGIIDLNFFLGDKNPETSVVKYHQYLGGWTIPAFWAMGHHQHKWWGYRNEHALKTVMDEYKKADLPLDVLWSDIEYLKGDTNFQIDTENFPPAHMNKLYADYQKRWVPVVQCFIPSIKTSAAHTFPNVMDLALRNANGTVFNGLSWSGLSYLTDFTHPKAKEFWHAMLKNIEEKWKFSGIWLDANELTTLWPARPPNSTLRKYGDLPFYPAGAYLFGAMALPYPDCVHADGTDEFNVRGMMGFLQCQFTYEYLQKEHKFPFVLSRSTMFGSGKFAMHWIADIWATWHHMSYSVGSIATFNIFGIPFTGTDVCGMVGHPRVDAELCARWYQLATFYPFSKNGHAPQTQWDNRQEPYTWEGDFFVAISRALKLRYSLLKYFYTLFFLSSGKEMRSGTVFRPLVFEFYDDPTLPPYGSGIHESQFLLGKSIMAAPVLEFRRSDVNVYFPNCRWYDLRDYQEVPVRANHHVASAKLTELPPFYLRGGSIFMQQDIKIVARTEDLDNKFSVIIGLDDFSADKKAQASGYLLDSPSYSEDDIHANCVEKNCLLKFEAVVELQENQEMTLKLNINREKDIGASGGFVAKNIMLMGIPEDRLSQSLSLKDSNTKLTVTGKTIEITFEQELTIQHGSQHTFIIHS